MDRRNFLKGLGTAGAVAWMVSGRSAAADILNGYSNPVSFVDPLLYDQEFQVDPAIDPGRIFTLSISSGDPRPHGIVLWTRVDPAAIGPDAPGSVAFEIASDAGFLAGSVVIRGRASLSSAHDYTVKLPIQHTKLEPLRTYYYRFIYNQCASRVGRFKTLPEAGASLERIRFAFISCQDYSNGYYTVLAHLAKEDADFVVFLGDYIYETVADPSFQNAQVRSVPPLPSGGNVAAGLEDYRHLYRVYKSDPNLQAVHERFTFIQLWDDHEFANDCYQDYHPDNNPNPDAPTPALRQAASQAWVEYGVADVPFDPVATPMDSVQVYRTFRFGNLMDLVATDERLYRDGPPCGDATGQRYLTQRCAAAESATRTMLGGTQREWFLDSVRNSTATWKFWANEVTAMQMKVGPDFVTLDQWDGYPAERANLLSNIGFYGVKNFIAITGDIHSFIAGYLKPNFDDASTPVGVELVVGSVSSANFTELALSQVPLPSAPLPVPIPTPPGLGVESVLMAGNPHMKFFNSSTHGYCLMDVAQSGLTCTMKAVTTIRQPQAELYTLKTFLIKKDSVELVAV